ncbi:hypothetical protein TSAR_011673 [Trichomalopsis sarcophagae]|uniref:Uncharacterized protein n=1 Tax=Trichomalopsis sarcophagae TaxID=543379 RepID=A0A232ETI2_9HYME|nr:hypothetical protein TSAR_011673 [Trichomalopsis sarcophagae]
MNGGMIYNRTCSTCFEIDVKFAMAIRRNQKEWVISDGEDEDEEVGLDVRELFALSKKKAVSAEPLVNNSEDTTDKFHTPNEEFALSQASSQLTLKESDTEKYFTADEDKTPNTRLENSLDAGSISEEEDPDEKIGPKVSQTTNAVVFDDEDNNSDLPATNEKEETVGNDKSENSSALKNLISDKGKEKTKLNEEEETEANIRPKVGQIRSSVRSDYEDENSDVIVIDDEETVVNDKSENSSAQEKSAVIYDDDDDDSDLIVINDEEDVVSNGSKKFTARKNLISDEEEEEEEEEETDKEVSKESDEPVAKKSKIVKPFGTVRGFQKCNDKNWWDQFLESVPDNQKCEIGNCSFAPQPHKKHDVNIRSYSLYETRLIIQYLIYHNVIEYGKGIKVWKDFHSLGYLTHRSIESLNNHFKRYILRDIKSYKLPKDIESKFLKLRTSRQGLKRLSKN